MIFSALVLTGTLAIAGESSQTTATFTRIEDVIYSRSYGTALTMDVFEPTGKFNGATAVWIVSGGWFSNHNSIDPDNPAFPVKPLTARGYRVCAVVHRSNPAFTVEDAIADVRRSIRFIRYKYDNDPAHPMPIGVMGGSAGGHLSLMLGTTGDDGDPNSKDPVEQRSSRVQAVACYFPPTDFLNYGKPGVNGLETILGIDYKAPFDFKRRNNITKALDLVTSKKLRNQILGEVAPANHVTEDDAPTLIIHGDADMLVPIQQSELIMEKFKTARVDAKLIRKPGLGHGWAGLEKDNEKLYEWLDAKLLNKQ